MSKEHPGCGGTFEEVRTPLSGFLVDGLRCSRCHELHHDPEHTQLVAAYNKLRDQTFEATVTTTGNSVALRIDKALVKEFGLDRGEKLSVVARSPTELVISLPEAIEPIREDLAGQPRWFQPIAHRSNALGGDIVAVENLPTNAVNKSIPP